jgi:hypothetical protein
MSLACYVERLNAYVNPTPVPIAIIPFAVPLFESKIPGKCN